MAFGIRIASGVARTPHPTLAAEQTTDTAREAPAEALTICVSSDAPRGLPRWRGILSVLSAHPLVLRSPPLTDLRFGPAVGESACSIRKDACSVTTMIWLKEERDVEF